MQETDFDGNEFIEDAIHQCYLQAEKDRVIISLDRIRGSEDLVPPEAPEPFEDFEDIENFEAPEASEVLEAPAGLEDFDTSRIGEGLIRESPEEDYLVRNVLEAVGYCMNLCNYFVLPLTISSEGLADVLAYSKREDGKEAFEVCREYNLERVKTGDGRNLLCAFTSGEEFLREYRCREQDCPCTMVMPIEEILRFVKEREDLDGLLLNRWGEGFLLDKRMYEIDETQET